MFVITVASQATWPETARKVSRRENSHVTFAALQTTTPEIAPRKTTKAKVMEGNLAAKEKTRAKEKVTEGKVSARAKAKMEKVVRKAASSVARRAAKVARKDFIRLTKQSRPRVFKPYGKKKRAGLRLLGKTMAGRAAGTRATGNLR